MARESRDVCRGEDMVVPRALGQRVRPHTASDGAIRQVYTTPHTLTEDATRNHGRVRYNTRSTKIHQTLKWCGGQAMWPSESGPLAQSGHRVHSLTFRPARHGTNAHSHGQSRLVTNTSWPHCHQQCAVNQTASARLCLSTVFISHTCCVTPPIYCTVY